MTSIDMRYLAGTTPWVFYAVQIQDGDGEWFWRNWNNYGYVISWDGASRTVDNTTHITPNTGFAPSFGSRGYIDIHVYPHFTAVPTWENGGNQLCTGDGIVMRFTKP